MQKAKQQRNTFLSSKRTTRQRKIFTITAIVIAISMTLIVLLPTFVVQVAKGDSTTETKYNDETSFSNDETTSVIEVSVERNDSKVVETVPLETYVASVVASEMPADFELDALKAQAVAARTYIVNHILHENEETISDTVDHQVYRNKEELQSLWGADFHWKWEKINRAVKETESEIITYDKQPITPTFFSMSNGYTEDAKYYWGNELPYLKSVESKWEEQLPNFKTQEVFTIHELEERLQVQLPDNNSVPTKIKRTPSNRVGEVQIGNNTFTGREIREKLNLRSTDFSITQRDNHFIFTTKGYGHGVGMSQYGANGMAKEGKTYKEIITYYYKDVSISRLDEVAPALVMNE